jgi:hypothetical protein
VGLQRAKGSLEIHSSYFFVLLLDSLGIMLNLGMDGVVLAGRRCSAGVALAAKVQQRTRGEGERSLQYFIFCEFNQNIRTLVALFLLQSPRLLEPIVVHGDWSGEAGGLQQEQRHQRVFFNT